MKKIIPMVTSAMLTVGMGVAAVAPASAGSIYLKLPNVTGPVTRTAFTGDIDLTAYSQSFTNPATANTGTAGAGKVSCGANNTAGLGITENISLLAKKFQVTYATTNVDTLNGTSETYGWDCTTNTVT